MGDLQKTVREQIEILRPDLMAIKFLHKISKEFISEIGKEIKRLKVDADVFVGGSFAKGTLLKSGNYDVDIFVRFDSKYESLSEMLEKIVVPVVKKLGMKLEKVHGSRDYFRVLIENTTGYFVELLILKYKSFVKMLRELVKVTSGKRIVIDLAKHYSNPKEVFIQLNESKIHSPVILIDPTYKERNALAALSQETFAKF